MSTPPTKGDVTALSCFLLNAQSCLSAFKEILTPIRVSLHRSCNRIRSQAGEKSAHALLIIFLGPKVNSSLKKALTRLLL